MDSILEVENLRVELKGEVILEDLSFSVKKKEILVILGPNGAGKTVLLKTLLDLFPFSGVIKWKRSPHIGYVPDTFTVPKTLPLSVKEFFKFKRIPLAKIRQSLKWVGITPLPRFLGKRVGTLSSGQLRRIMIAWAMTDEPDVILLDEPMVGIDIHGRETIYDSLIKLWQEKNKTIILVSHEIGEICKDADKILALNKKKLFYGSPKEIINTNNLIKIYGGAISL